MDLQELLQMLEKSDIDTSRMKSRMKTVKPNYSGVCSSIKYYQTELSETEKEMMEVMRMIRRRQSLDRDPSGKMQLLSGGGTVKAMKNFKGTF